MLSRRHSSYYVLEWRRKQKQSRRHCRWVAVATHQQSHLQWKVGPWRTRANVIPLLSVLWVLGFCVRRSPIPLTDVSKLFLGSDLLRNFRAFSVSNLNDSNMTLFLFHSHRNDSGSLCRYPWDSDQNALGPKTNQKQQNTQPTRQTTKVCSPFRKLADQRQLLDLCRKVSYFFFEHQEKCICAVHQTSCVKATFWCQRYNQLNSFFKTKPK